MEFALRAALIGVGATLVMDLWALVLKRVYEVPALDYALVGRWIGHMPAGRLCHVAIAAAPRIKGERVIGWAAHYAIGIVFAALLLAVFGLDWAGRPTLGPALAIGLVTVAAPFFLMQPCLGFGFVASRTPKPTIARLRSLIAHLMFGMGLYGAAWMLAQLATD